MLIFLIVLHTNTLGRLGLFCLIIIEVTYLLKRSIWSVINPLIEQPTNKHMPIIQMLFIVMYCVWPHIIQYALAIPILLSVASLFNKVKTN